MWTDRTATTIATSLQVSMHMFANWYLCSQEIVYNIRRMSVLLEKKHTEFPNGALLKRCGVSGSSTSENFGRGPTILNDCFFCK